MTATIRRLMLITDVRRTRLALAALLGVLTILFGVGLMGTAGYLISKAAEHPAVLSLTAAIVGVRFFGLARPLARYLERLASHDVALRSLGRARAQVYEAVEGGVEVTASNCVQCGAITAKGGRLTPPEGGSGPEYTLT